MKNISILNFKVLAVYPDYILGARGYKIDKYTLDGKRLEHVGTLEDSKYSKWAKHKLSRRLFRAEIIGFYNLDDGSMLAVAKKGLFKKNKKEKIFKKVFNITRGSKPLNICIAKNGTAYFGEYFQNMKKQAVNIYGSDDNGQSWNVVYTFPEGNINHIHGLFYDPYTDRIWVVTGDRENECIIGWTDDGFQTINELFRGGQEYRNCLLFFYQDYIVYATDSQYIENEIRRIDRKTREITVLQTIQGSAIKGGQCGDVAYLSTTVEPSEVNRDKFTHVWMSYNGIDWKEVFKAKKDSWPSILQYATFEFPIHHAVADDRLYFCGRAVNKLDGKSIYVKI